MPRRRLFPPFRVQIVINADLEYFREVVLGARRYGFETGRLVFADRWLPHELADLPWVVKRDGVQGIVAAIFLPPMEAAMRGAGVPVVNVSNSMRVPQVPVVTQDDVAVGRLAAEHLRACGCRNFGFWGQTRASYSDQRWQGFREGLDPDATVWREASKWDEPMEEMFARMQAWLPRLEPPAGVFTVLDSHALVMMRAAKAVGRRVPEELAVLGAGDDDFFVEFESVPLSSIRLPARKIGYEAAALLDRMIADGARTAESVQLPVGEVARRRSTDVQFVDDPLVAAAVRLMRARPDVRVSEVVRAAGVARSGLQRRFLRALGRGLLAELQRVRLLRAQALLAHTDLKLEAVAEQSGFPSVQRLSAYFQSELGLAPGAWRHRRIKRG